jgi:DNA-binding beta-propeller fold protein YncE
MAITAPPHPRAPSGRETEQTDSDAQALFEEARRRRRRRYRYGALVLLGVLGVGTGLLISSGPSPQRTEKPRLHKAPARPAVAAPVLGTMPRQPGPLAVGPTGTLYVADDALDQILERLPDGRFQVVAGKGTFGFSGDGGPAVDAQLGGPEGMVVGSDGVLYFADSGNNRVRAVEPDGIITTVAGNGQPAAGFEDTPLLGASAVDSAIGTTEALAVGPDGSLYLAAANAVLELHGDGTLSMVADSQNFLGVDQRYPQTSTCDPDGLAFDGTGDLYMACSNTYDLLEETAAGTFTYRGILRPHDAHAALTAGPDGSVLGLWQSSVQRYASTTQQQEAVNFDTVKGVGDFWPQGVAVAADGTVYFDQDGISGIGPPAIVAQSPSGVVTALWSHLPASHN